MKSPNIVDIDNDQKTSLLGFCMVLTTWLGVKGVVTEVDTAVIEAFLFLLFSFYTNRPDGVRGKDEQ